MDIIGFILSIMSLRAISLFSLSIYFGFRHRIDMLWILVTLLSFVHRIWRIPGARTFDTLNDINAQLCDVGERKKNCRDELISADFDMRGELAERLAREIRS